MPAGKPDVTLGPYWLPSAPIRPKVLRWNESVLNIKPDVEYALGPSVQRARTLAESGAFLSLLAKQTSGEITSAIFKEGVGRIAAQIKEKLPRIQELEVQRQRDQQVVNQRADQVRRGPLVAAPPVSVDFQLMKTGQYDGRILGYGKQYRWPVVSGLCR